MELTTFLLFAATTSIVVFSPGPAALTVASQGSGSGFLYAFFGIIGVATANALYFVFSATGIASLIIASNLVFTVIKWIGVVYLIYLGLSAIFSRSGGLKIVKGSQENRRTLFAKGFIVEFANPKALLYFAAILPQFLDITQSIAPQIFVMGLTTIFLDVIIYSVYAYLGQAISQSGVKSWVIKSINSFAGSAILFAAFKMTKVHN